MTIRSLYVRHVLLAIAVCSVGILAGCGKGADSTEDGVVVKGKIIGLTPPGAKAPPGTSSGRVFLISEEKRKQKADIAAGAPTGIVDSNGEFEIRGDGKGVKPGVYFLAIASGAEGTPDAATSSKNAIFGGAFTAAKTPIKIDIPSDKVGGEHTLDPIDLNSHLKK